MSDHPEEETITLTVRELTGLRSDSWKDGALTMLDDMRGLWPIDESDYCAEDTLCKDPYALAIEQADFEPIRKKPVAP